MGVVTSLENAIGDRPGSPRLARPARICFPFSGDAIGGSHYSALGLIRQFDRTHYDPLVVVQHENGRIARLFREEQVQVVCPFAWPELPFDQPIGFNALRAMFVQLGRQVSFIRDNEIRIVHSNDGRTHSTWALATKLAGAKLLWHHRGAPHSRGLRFFAPFVADKVLAVSEYALPRPGPISAAQIAEVVYSPFDTRIAVDRAEARRELVAEFDLPPDCLLVGYCGSFVARKRPLLFVETVRTMRQLAPSRRVVGIMFGAAEDPRMDEAIRVKIAELDDPAAIRLAGWRQDGARCIAGCDLLMSPAVDEPFGRTLVEAMLVGTPIIATRSGGNAEALRGGRLGRLVEAENAEALARAALDLTPQQAREISTAAQIDARSRFGLERHYKKVAQVYEALLASRS